MKKLLSILLVSIMLLTPLAMTAGAQTLKDSLIESTPTENKITSELSTYLEGIDNDEYVKIYVWLNDYGEDMLYQVLSKRLGATITVETEENYIVSKISAKKQFLKEGLERLSKSGEYNTLSTIGKIEAKSLSADDFRAQALIPEVMTDTEIQTCLESQMTSDEIISLSERTQFLKDYRATRKALNTSVNDTFYQKLNLNKCKNVYLDPLLARVTMECEKSYIDNLESMDIVKEIGYSKQTKRINFSQSDSNDFSNITNFGYYMEPHETLGYNGAGIKVGVLEAAETLDNGQHTSNFDRYNPHLVNRGIITNVSANDPISEHATSVLSILAGSNVTIGETTYQGISTDSTIYYTSEYGTDVGVDNALEWFVDNDVSIINISWGEYYTDDFGYVWGYNDIDKQFDEYVQEYRMVIVVAAGNYHGIDEVEEDDRLNVSNPASAYNVITVGNVSNITYSTKYRMYNESCYKEKSYATNKPDISAFGTHIYMFAIQEDNTYNKTDLGKGTSFSAPMVAGAITFMLQANSNLIGKPDTVKALLLGSANESILANTYTSDSTFEIVDSQKIENVVAISKDKSGAGLLNIPASIRSAISGIYFDCIGGDHTTDKIYIAANTTIKFGVVYEKYTDEVLDSAYSHQTDIQIIDSSESVVFKSTDTINNVEMFTCTIKQGGVYKFRIDSTVGAGVTSQMNSTIVLTCDCTNKNLVKAGCSGAAHSISCDCGFEILETHNWTPTVVINLSNGATFFTDIEYLYKRGNTANGEFMCFIENTYFSNPSGTNMTLQGLGPVENYSIEYTSTGKIVRYSYSLIIEENGQYSFITTRQVTFVYDYFAKTITAY